MDLEAQAQIKKIAEETGKDNIVVILGASDIEGAEITAETLTVGDPSYAGPLAGVSLRLPVYHILEPEIKAEIPEDIYEQQVGIVSMIVDTEEVGQKFKAIRESVAAS
jgi:glycine reductase